MKVQCPVPYTSPTLSELTWVCSTRDVIIPTVINGKNPIVAHEFLGSDIKGKSVIIIDDMISSGESMLDVAKQMKDRGAKQVFVCTTFGLFTDGFEKFDEFHEKGYIDRVITTDLTYLPPAFYEREYFTVADMSKFIALMHRFHEPRCIYQFCIKSD